MAAIREQAVERGRAVLELAVGDAEAHVTWLRRDSELGQQPLEVGVVPVVQDDEARVDVKAAGLGLNGDGVGVPADPIRRLEHRDLVLSVEQMGGDQAGYAGADDCDLHGAVSLMSRSDRARRWAGSGIYTQAHRGGFTKTSGTGGHSNDGE